MASVETRFCVMNRQAASLSFPSKISRSLPRNDFQAANFSPQEAWIRAGSGFKEIDCQRDSVKAWHLCYARHSLAGVSDLIRHRMSRNPSSWQGTISSSHFLYLVPQTCRLASPFASPRRAMYSSQMQTNYAK